MRNPQRIEQILSELGVYWKAHPDYRLGQIVENYARSLNSAVFFVEDSEILEFLKKENDAASQE